MEQKHKNININIVVWFATLCLYVVSFITNRGFIIVGVSAVVFIIYLCVHKGKFSIRLEGIYFYLIIFCLYCYFSAFWAENSALSIARSNSVLTVVVFFVVLRLIYNDEGFFYDLLKLIKWGNYCVLGYAIVRYGWSTFIEVLRDESRISNDFLNANTLGLCAAYAIVITVFLILYEKFRIADLLIIFAIVILAASGSRKALITVIAGVLAVVVLKNLNNRNFLRSLFRIIIGILIVVLAIWVLSRIPAFNSIFERVGDLFSFFRTGQTSNGSIWIRSQYNVLGVQLFSKNPMLGIGLDNARIHTLEIFGNDHYLHNNYVELLACTGIFGTVIYYSIYAYIVYIMLRFCKLRDGEWDICMTLLVIHLIMDYGMVSYFSKSTYVYLLLFWIEAQRLKRKYKNKDIAHY